MSIQITTAFVQQYKANVVHLTQQKGSKLRRACQIENVTGKASYVDQLGATAARKRTSRHADTPRMDTPHARRRIATESYDWADLIDREDQIRMLIDPTSKYAEAAAMAMGRAMDDAIIAAATATAYAGEDGTTAVAYDTNMTVPVTARWPGVTSDNCGLNVAKLIEAKRLLGRNNVDPDDERWLVVNENAIASLMKDTHLVSGDYNTLRPLMDGNIIKFYGFNIIPIERLTQDGSGYDQILYWAKGGMALGVGQDIMTKITEMPTKNYATQVFASMDVGATRLEEVRVGVILCDTDGGPEGNLD